MSCKHLIDIILQCVNLDGSHKTNAIANSCRVKQLCQVHGPSDSVSGYLLSFILEPESQRVCKIDELVHGLLLRGKSVSGYRLQLDSHCSA